MCIEINGAPFGSRKVLHLITSLRRGGAETQLSYLCGPLSELGWEVHIGLSDASEFAEELRSRAVQSGAVLHPIGLSGSYDVRSIGKVGRLIKSVQPDIVQTWLPRMDVVGGIAALLAKRAWILSERNADPPEATTWQLRIRNRLGLHASSIVSNSQAGALGWLARGYDPSRSYVIRNSLPLDDLDRIRRAAEGQEGSRDGRPTILFAGRLEPQKNVEGLLVVASMLLSRRDVQFVILGRGSLEARLRSQADALGISDRVRFAGFSNDAWKLMRSADLFVSLSHFEGMPNTVMEAMALGVPIVVSDIASHREICDPGCAVLVDRFDSARIVDAMEECIDDGSASARRAAAAILRTREWSREGAARLYADVYHDALRARRK